MNNTQHMNQAARKS